MNLSNPAMSPVQPKTLIGMLSNKCLMAAAGEEFMVWYSCRTGKAGLGRFGMSNAIIGIMGKDKVLEKRR